MILKNQKIQAKELNPNERIKNFDEVALGYSEEEALQEASRCLNCKIAKCQQNCPVNINIPKFIQEIKNKNFDKAFEIIKERNSLPCITGRICPQETQCEGACIMGIKGDPVNIGNLERFVADLAAKNNYSDHTKILKKNKKVAIIGSGPAGLECAGECAKYGYDVTIFEALHEIGGVLRYGIPKFRLPANVLENEISELKKLGVHFEVNVAVGLTLTLNDLKEEGFEAFFIAIGAGVPYFLNIKNENLQNIYSANEFLTRINLMNANIPSKYDTPINLGEKAIVIGGGNVAMDSARILLRLGVKEVNIVYRRTKDEMPARKAEVHHAEEEGIIFHFLKEPLEFLGDEKGQISGLKLQNMELTEEVDRKNRKKVKKIENSFTEILADIAIIAIGQNTNYILAEKAGIKINEHNHIIVNSETLETNIEGIFAGGDVITGADTVISAMGAGKKAAKSIDEHLSKK